MKRIIHICFSEGAKANLNNAMKQGFGGLLEEDKIIYLIDNLSNGPINDINDISDIYKRITWQKNFSIDYDFLKQIEFNYNNFHNNIEKVENEDIYIWYGESGMEMCGLFYTLSLLQDRINNIYTINISEEIHSNNNTIIKHSRVGEIHPKWLKWFIDKKEKLEAITFNQHINSWLILKQANINLRTIKDKKVISVQEDYFDEMIMYYTEDIFTSCIRTVGSVFGNVESYLSDAYIFWRIHELIKNNKIAFNGNLGSIRKLEIKRV
ncbi:MAG: DUF3658 domain-containing protein [Desulfosporosinus sp.]|nr:DUF3658 domain-containing protein [Desulfosporosinus sp.]